MKKLLHTILSALVLTSALPAAAQTADLPYEITFTQSNYSTWTVLDANGDGDNFGAKKWAWSSSCFCYNLTSSVSGNSNDWAISPALALEAGTQYEISYYFYGYSGSAKNIPVYLRLMTSNTTPQPEAMLIASYPSEGNPAGTNKNGEAATATFTAPSTGTYYIGAEVNAAYQGYVSGGVPPEMSGKIVFRNFGIKALQKATAPGALNAFTATVSDDDINKVNFAFTTPTLDADGAALSGNVTVSIYRQGEETPFFTSETMAPGTAGTATDTAPLKGQTTYTAKAANGSGEGVPSEVSLWVGEDVPCPASNVAATVVAGKVQLSWTAPTAGANGATIYLDRLKYAVTRVADGVAAEPEIVSGTSFTDETLSDATQTNVLYRVVARSSGGDAQAAESNLVNFGPQLALPFADSFARAKFTTSPWAQQVVKNFDDANYSPEWSVIAIATVTDNVTDDNPEGDEITIKPVDSDGGMLRFNSSQVGKMNEAARGRLIFPAIDFSQMLNPVLTFYMFRETYYTTNPATNNGRRDDHVTVEMRSDNGEFAPVVDAEFHRYGTENNWVKCEVPLYTMAGKSRVQVALNGAGMGGGPIYIDNIKIDERIAYDLQASALTGPARVRCGEEGLFTVMVKNAGGFVASDYTVKLLNGSTVVASESGKELKPGRTLAFNLKFTPEIALEGTNATITAQVDFAPDQDLTNNVTDPAEVRITAPLLPAVKEISGSATDGTVSLSWNAPDYLPAETLVEQDGFEAYEPFTINTFGEFTCFDLDNRVTFGIGAAAGVTYPGSGEKIAFQVFAPTLTNIDEEELHLWATHSGQNMVISPQAMASGNAVASNDWLVFPALSGNAQTIKFFARSLNSTYSEFIQGFYSSATSATDAEDFIPCPDGGEISYSVPTEWTELTYSVPAGGRRFALRHVSADGYALMIDDVTYQRSIPTAAEAGLEGYNVYCNGEKITPTPATERSLTHTPAARGTYSYEVAAVYPKGESARSKALELMVEVDGINGLLALDGYALAINGLLVSCTAPCGLRLFTPAGIMVAHGESAVEAPVAGVYVLMVANKAHKVVLR